ncbi:hypothetical protein AHF37_02347 [Paragonimus kellicotti]|nr:hypothetical protein AHF37_02347 [Paragonimus kellicotti]
MLLLWFINVHLRADSHASRAFGKPAIDLQIALHLCYIHGLLRLRGLAAVGVGDTDIFLSALDHSISVFPPSHPLLANFLDSLIACSLVNRAWFHAARNPQLYRRLCQLPEWCSPVFDKRLLLLCGRTEQNMCSSGLTPRRHHSGDCCALSDCSLPSGLKDRQQQQVDWFTIFKKRSRLRHNWLLGRCRIRQFTGHSEGM